MKKFIASFVFFMIIIIPVRSQELIDSSDYKQIATSYKLLRASQIASITGAILLMSSAESFYETFGKDSDVILISNNKRTAWTLFTLGVITEGLSIAGITIGMKKIRNVRECVEMRVSINNNGLFITTFF